MPSIVGKLVFGPGYLLWRRIWHFTCKQEDRTGPLPRQHHHGTAHKPQELYLMPEQRGDGQGQVAVGAGVDVVASFRDPAWEVSSDHRGSLGGEHPQIQIIKQVWWGTPQLDGDTQMEAEGFRLKRWTSHWRQQALQSSSNMHLVVLHILSRKWCRAPLTPHAGFGCGEEGMKTHVWSPAALTRASQASYWCLMVGRCLFGKELKWPDSSARAPPGPEGSRSVHSPRRAPCGSRRRADAGSAPSTAAPTYRTHRSADARHSGQTGSIKEEKGSRRLHLFIHQRSEHCCYILHLGTQ